MTGKVRTPEGVRFARFFDVVADGCWEWRGAIRKNGYGKFTREPRVYRGRGQTVSAHRMAWTLAYGDIPDGLMVLHRCDNRKCVRPDHLFLGTAQDMQATWSQRVAPDRATGTTPAPSARGS